MTYPEPPPPDESEPIVDRFFRVTSHLSLDGRQRVLEALLKAEQSRKARVATGMAIKRAKESS